MGEYINASGSIWGAKEFRKLWGGLLTRVLGQAVDAISLFPGCATVIAPVPVALLSWSSRDDYSRGFDAMGAAAVLALAGGRKTSFHAP